MADNQIHSFDLFGEIDSVCQANSKIESEFNFFEPDDLNIDIGLPSNEITNNYDMLGLDTDNIFVDFIDNPFISNNEALTNASIQNSERIMQVSIPAETTEFEIDQDQNSNQLEAYNKPDQNPCKPIGEDIINTEETKANTKMVAPLILLEPPRKLVRIPKVDTDSSMHITSISKPINKPEQVLSVGTAKVAELPKPIIPRINENATSSPIQETKVKEDTVSKKVLVERPAKISLPSTLNHQPKVVLSTIPESSSERNSNSVNRVLRSRKRKSPIDEVAESCPKNTKSSKISKLSNKKSNKDTAENLRHLQARVKDSMKFKAYELEKLNDPVLERCRRNAINAKKNRELKKAKMEELENTIAEVQREKNDLAGTNEGLRKEKEQLENEVKYLKNIIQNQSQISELLQKLGSSEIRFETPTTDDVITSGMCLHVNGDTTVMKVCSYCALD